MSIVPYRPGHRPPRRPPLDQRSIVRTALALLDEVGLDELTMRALADRLGVKAASLYRHVRNKDELLILLGDEISGGIALVPQVGTWQQQLAAIARNVRKGLLAHRDSARLLAATPPLGPRRLQLIEQVLRVLRAAGLSPRNAARTAHHLNNFLMEFVADESRFEAFAAASGSSRRKMIADARRQFRALPADEYPTLVKLADELTEDDPDGLFQFGIDAWLRAIAALART
ncbi:MAG TPA: TetR/AcrR family transcriptional regulator C-terminal domain-containing protein [Vicinamibacterales bacterium]|jgi:TetR/AcrR family tetracycline transcriptional repressor